MYLGKKTPWNGNEQTKKYKTKNQEEVGKMSWMFNHFSFTDIFIITSKLKESLSSASLKSLVQRIPKLQKPFLVEKLVFQIFLAGTNENPPEVLQDCMGSKFPYVSTM